MAGAPDDATALVSYQRVSGGTWVSSALSTGRAHGLTLTFHVPERESVVVVARSTGGVAWSASFRTPWLDLMVAEVSECGAEIVLSLAGYHERGGTITYTLVVTRTGALVGATLGG